MTALRLCLVSRELAPFFGAGIGTYAAAMARAWAAAGHEVHILTASHEEVRQLLAARAQGHESADPFPGIHLHIAGEPEGPLPRFPFQRHAWSVYRALLRLHAERPFDAIEFADYWAEGSIALAAHRTLGAFAGATLIVRLHTPTRLCRVLNDETWLDEELATLQCAEERAIRDAHLVLSPSRALLDRVQLRPEQPAAVIPYPFDPLPPAPLPASREGQPPTILYFGRLEKRKGVELLIRASLALLPEFPGLRVRLIGADTRTGPGATSLRAHLQSLIPRDLAGSFSFEPPLPRHGLAPIIADTVAAGGICCFPSLWENFPNACLEAMSLGACTVAPDSGGPAEIIQHGISGLIFRTGDTSDLAAKLRLALADAPLRQSLGTAAMARIAQLCAPSSIVEQTARAIRECRPAPITTSPHTQPIPTVPISDLDGAPQSSWLIITAPGAQLAQPTALSAAIHTAASRDPSLALLACAATDGQALHIPYGLEPELLPILPTPAIGAVALRRDAVDHLASFHQDPAPTLWDLCCRAAAAGFHSAVIPEPLVHAAPQPPAPATHIAADFGCLAPDASVPLRIAQAAHTAEAARLRAHAATLAQHTREQQQRIEALEQHLASLRYKLADRVNEAIKSTGLHGLAKAALGRGDKAEPGP